MSSEIDWSQAPEGATHWEPKTANVIAGWMRLDGEKWFFWPISTRDASDIRWHECVNDMSVRSEYMIKRPATPSWSGEGLPPVGVVCEVYHDDRWYETTIIGVDPDDGSRVFKTHPDYDTPYDGFVSASSFRHIRTPEQIAEIERQKIADMLWQRYLQPILAPAQEAQVKAALGLIYDDFYRKP